MVGGVVAAGCRLRSIEVQQNGSGLGFVQLVEAEVLAASPDRQDAHELAGTKPGGTGIGKKATVHQ